MYMTLYNHVGLSTLTSNILKTLKPGFHMIATITTIVMIARVVSIYDRKSGFHMIATIVATVATAIVAIVVIILKPGFNDKECLLCFFAKHSDIKNCLLLHVVHVNVYVSCALRQDTQII